MARILVVEDHDGVREIVATGIEAAGHQTDCVRSRAEAEQALKRLAYDLLICDLRLPDGSGADLIVKARDLGVRGVLMTDHPEDADDDKTAHIPCVARLLKPFRLDELRRIIETCLRA